MSNSPRSRQTTGPWFEQDVLWGVPRRAGYSDTDDPEQHAGVTQHAFELGLDERAICGFVAPRRRSMASLETRPQLATAGPDNPRCSRCDALIAPRPREADAGAERPLEVDEAPAPPGPTSASDPATAEAVQRPDDNHPVRRAPAHRAGRQPKR
jgi:hypothetical protein